MTVARLQVPEDVDAEAVIAASVLTYPEAWPTVAAQLSVDDFRQRTYWQTIETCSTLPERCELPPMPTDDTSWLGEWWVPYTAREIAAVEAGVPLYLVGELRGYHATANPATYVRRLQDATRRRDAMRRLADAYNLLGAGHPLDDINQLLAGVGA